jgi:hypothetical protein
METVEMIAALLPLRDNLSCLPLERMAMISETDPKMYGRTTGKTNSEKTDRTARLIAVRDRLSPGERRMAFPPCSCAAAANGRQLGSFSWLKYTESFGKCKRPMSVFYEIPKCVFLGCT